MNAESNELKSILLDVPYKVFTPSEMEKMRAGRETSPNDDWMVEADKHDEHGGVVLHFYNVPTNKEIYRAEIDSAPTSTPEGLVHDGFFILDQIWWHGKKSPPLEEIHALICTLFGIDPSKGGCRHTWRTPNE